MVARPGGAMLLARMLMREASPRPVVSYKLENIESIGPDRYPHSLLDLRMDRDEPSRYHVQRLRGFSGPERYSPPPLLPDFSPPSVLVLDDAGNGFRDAEAAWAALVQARPGRLVYKMARPLAKGKLWNAVRRGPPTEPHGERDPQRLVVVVNADELRAEGVNISRRLSWERTAEDFVRHLGANGSLAALITCANLIVRFDCDAVIHHRGLSAETPTLYFDPERAEGEFVDSCPGRMISLAAAFTAGLTAALAVDPANGLDDGIGRGMTAARRLNREGFRRYEGCPPDYPVQRLFGAGAKPDGKIESVRIPSQRISAHSADTWSILEDNNGAAVDEIALRVAERGLKALHAAPIGRFGKLETADRREIESFRSVANLLREYLDSKHQTKPISIGVFGPPGSGKSFGVTEVIGAIAQGREVKVKQLEFNLSQFTLLDDLNAAFHLVRDEALGGKLPVAFFDEFDVTFEEPLGWLKYLLAPMQDGKFREQGALHPIGRAIFVFAGGLSSSFAAFSAPLDPTTPESQRRAFINAKGPDFVSRLRGHVDIMGPDPISPDDRMYPIRRAILLRSLVNKHASQLIGPNELLKIDPGVLRALLSAPSYRHGVRSMEAILLMSGLSGRRTFERSALPAPAQLAMHVDPDAFAALVAAERLPDDLREILGRQLHQRYVEHRRRTEPPEKWSGDLSICEWELLDEKFRESSRLQADDIPRKLRRIDCYMAPRSSNLTKGEINENEKLAEMEHDRYNAERLQRQWRLGPRDPSQRTNPFLRPWEDLDDATKDYDRHAVEAIPDVLASIDYGIYRLG